MLTELLQKSLTNQPQRRIDRYLWVSDLGSHPERAMRRVMNKEMTTFDVVTLDKMNLGTVYENDTVARLARVYPGTIHTQFPLFNEMWSGYADAVLDHGTDKPVIVEHKAVGEKYWAHPFKGALDAEYAPVKGAHLCQLWMYGQLYFEQYNVFPRLVLLYRSWGKICEVEIVAENTDSLTVAGELDGQPFQRRIPIMPALLRDELENLCRRRFVPENIHGIAPDTWTYAEERTLAQAQ